MRKYKLEELGRKTIEEFQATDKIPLVLVADNIRSGLNVGAFFRSADAFAIQEIILTGLSPTPPHKEINKSAIGATMSVAWQYKEDVVEAIQDLKKQGYLVYGIEQTNESYPLAKFKCEGKVAIVMGNEVDGISTDALPLLDGAIEIPQYGTKHSLNVAVCAGIVLHALSNQMRVTI